MEDRVLPLVFLNLCGEMLYVILQRLEAQKISAEKASKVVQDIISTMLNSQFIEELFKPQKMYTRLAMQSVFEKLVHSSIMRLNSNSMGKLYDLMLMVFKYQLVNCRHPKDLLLVTLNHLDAIRDCARPYPDLLSKVKDLHTLIISNYRDLSNEQYECLYKSIEVFLEGMNIRVSVLMKLGLQSSSGEIIKVHGENLSEGEFDEKVYDFDTSRYTFEGKRGFLLGTNIYLQSYNAQILEVSHRYSESPVSKSTVNVKDVFQGMEELSLLTRLIGKCAPVDTVPEIFLASPDEVIYENTDVSESKSTVINIDASDRHRQELEKISEDLIVNKEERKSDILELLDAAEFCNN